MFSTYLSEEIKRFGFQIRRPIKDPTNFEIFTTEAKRLITWDLGILLQSLQIFLEITKLYRDS